MNKLATALLLVGLLAGTACSNNSEKDKEKQDSIAANATADSLLKAATDTVSAADSAATDHTATDSVKH
ncbi:hypothetical protein GS399_08650 [Pedobacter sp. HMF7647]|uniref:Entericidin n=1 Tax=Hufsiella arboris TaxID=2695275 RepID=A0A7K1Y8W9_9SPHI|nr:hypothetical protein [Hufsiella arboris]MXV51036.1 hypothetical protein [Hufsiella arboris]